MAKKAQPNKFEFTVKIDEKDVKFVVVKPTRGDEQAAEEERARVFTDLFRKKHLINEEIDKMARERNLWDDARQSRLESISKFLEESGNVVLGRVKGTTKSEGRKLAIDMRIKRNEMVVIQRGRSNLINNTVESKAGDAKFNFVMTRCVKYAETNKPYYKSVEDMLELENDPVYGEAIKGMMIVYLDQNPDWQKELPENVFLLKYGYCNDELFLIDPATKRLVDEDGKFINDKGELVNEDNHLINKNGELLDENGEVKGETFEFIDDAVSSPKEKGAPALPLVKLDEVPVPVPVLPDLAAPTVAD